MRRYNPEYHHRRSVRLQGYDYTQQGAYFITICTHQREYLFGTIENAGMRINPYGGIVLDCWNGVPAHFPHVDIDAFVVMPNHVHGIIVIQQAFSQNNNLSIGAMHALPSNPTASFGKPVAGSIGVIVGAFKSAVARQVNKHRATLGALVWQRNYHEHIIRDEKSLNTLREYIANNPALWEQDKLYGKGDVNL